MIKVLTIAGSDPSGGAGIQADIKTIAAHGAYAMSVITALTAQNTLGVFGIHPVPSDFVTAQLKAVLSDLFPEAIKIGMVVNTEIIRVIAESIRLYTPQNIVLDPVMVSTSGSKLLNDEAMDCLLHDLIPRVHLLTPNIPEAEVFTGITIDNNLQMEKAAHHLAEKFQVPILLKGGHLNTCSDDFLITDQNSFWLKSNRLHTHNTHGTGCTLSSAIACQLASGKSLLASVTSAKAYVYEAISKGLDIGQGNGPIDHSVQATDIFR
jgi:hydroxymethylpyrimidine/phosphomethylpyrimidine kinase